MTIVVTSEISTEASRNPPVTSAIVSRSDRSAPARRSSVSKRVSSGTSWYAHAAIAATTATRPPVTPARSRSIGRIRTSLGSVPAGVSARSAARWVRSCSASCGVTATRAASVPSPPTTSIRSSTTPNARCVSFRITSTLWIRGSWIVRSHCCTSPPRRWSACSSSRYQNRLHRTTAPISATLPANVARPTEPEPPPRNRKNATGSARPPRTPDAHTAIAAGWSRRHATKPAAGGVSACSWSGRGGTGSDALGAGNLGQLLAKGFRLVGSEARDPCGLPGGRVDDELHQAEREVQRPLLRLHVLDPIERDQREDVEPRAAREEQVALADLVAPPSVPEIGDRRGQDDGDHEGRGEDRSTARDLRDRR